MRHPIARFVLSLALLSVLAGCRLPSLLPHVPAPGSSSVSSAQGVAPLRGQLRLDDRSAQASVTGDPAGDNIANGATVSLIDARTGDTIATTLSQPDGSFSLSFGPAFHPEDATPYYLEAFKGVRGANPEFNLPGEDALRLRTIVLFDRATGKWKSLTDGAPGGAVSLGERTTALCVAIALKLQAGETVAIAAYMGALEGPYQDTGSIGAATFERLVSLVHTAIANNRDPLHYTVYDVTKGEFLNTYVGFAIASLSDASGAIGAELTVSGTGFAKAASVGVGDVAAFSQVATVSIGGGAAEILSVSDSLLKVKVSPGARTGPVSVQIGPNLQAGPTYQVLFSDGHQSFLDGKLYAANPAWGTVTQIAPDAAIKALLTGLASPNQVVVGPDKQLYVACGTLSGNPTSNRIVRLDPATPGTYELFGPVLTNPYGLAFSGDKLYVTIDGGQVQVLDKNGTLSATEVYTGFSKPRGIAFDAAGRLYVAESGRAVDEVSVTRMTCAPNGGDRSAGTPWARIPSPLGLALDSAGNCFVASNTGNVVFQISASGFKSVYAAVNSPGGLTLDEAGNKYVSDTSRNLVNRISPQGDTFVHAYGISKPRGLARDSSGNLYVSLSESHAVVRIDAQGTLTTFLRGIANPQSLTFGNDGSQDGIFIAHLESGSVSFADLSGRLRTLVPGITAPGGVERAADGTLYVGRNLSNTGRSRRLGGFDAVSAAGLLSTFNPLVASGTDGVFLAMDGQTLYVTDPLNKTLVRIDYLGANNSYRTHLVHTFAATPGMIACDAAHNVYVAVAAEHKVYRFAAGTDAQYEITGFNKPYGLTFASGALYVSNQGDGNLRRVLTPAAANAAVDPAWSPLTVGKGVMGIAAKGGRLYMANGTPTIQWYDLAADATGSFYTMPASVRYVQPYPAPSDDWFALCTNNLGYRLFQGPPMYVNNVTDSYGSALDADGNMYVNNSWTCFLPDPQKPTTSYYLGYSMDASEVALDRDRNRLYMANSDNQWNIVRGVVGMDLGTGDEFLYRTPNNAYALALSSSRSVFVGSTSQVYELDPDTATQRAVGKDLSTTAYGMDVDSSDTLWIVGDNNRVFKLPWNTPSNVAATTYYYGLNGPVF